ncbi:MAG: hypothetical protein KF831_06800 [Acidobacteria bacterium]|nr:hypothetical protein [Acidobacteriota bacterium]
MTKAQARKLAKQIFDRFDKQIFEATNGTMIEPAFVAGLIANEAGKDRAGNINRSATRFEPHVFAALKAVRDGRRTSYSGIRRADVADASDKALRALATSYEATQIMGWHVVKNLRCTIADLRNPDKHLFYTVKLLQLNGYTKRLDENQMDREMRQWNTGREDGKTYHANYVPNARLIRAAYRELEADRLSRTVEERTTAQSEPIPPFPPAIAEPAEVPAPEPYQGVGFWAVIKRDLVAATGGNLTFASLAEYAQQASGWPEWVVGIVTKIAVGLLIATIGYFVFRVIHFAVDSWKKNKKVSYEVETRSAADRRDIEWVTGEDAA